MQVKLLITIILKTIPVVSYFSYVFLPFLIQSKPSLPANRSISLLLSPQRLCWCICTLLPNLLSLQIKPHRDGNQRNGDASEQRGRPLNSHAVEHLLREEREYSSTQTTQEGICSDCGGSKLLSVSIESDVTNNERD